MANPPAWTNKKPVTYPKTQISTKARVSLNAAAFDEMVKQQGIFVKCYRTLLCPNVKDIDGGQHEIDCPLCKGSNFYDTHCIETMAFIQSQAGNIAPEAEGLIDQFSAYATFLQGINLQYFTLVEVPDHYDTFIERIKRQPGPIDLLKYKAIEVNTLVDSNGKEYYCGNDFTIDVNGNILWKANRGPAVSTIYSIHYNITLQFRAVKAIHVNRFAQVSNGANIEMTRMNEQWALEKVYLAERKDFRGSLLSPNLIRDPDEP
jgi:hypothetical protein